MENYERSGVWWLPEDTTQKLSGTFAYSQEEGLSLKLIGGHFPEKHDAPFTLYSIILGHTERGEDVTLFLCQAGQRNQTMNGNYVQQVLWAERAYVGTHLSERNGMLFQGVHIQFSHLLNWDQQMRFQILPTVHKPWEYGVTLTNPNAVTAETTKGKVMVSFGHGASQSRQRVEVFRTANISVEARQDCTVDDFYYQFIYPLQNLLTLATDTPNMVTGLQVMHKNVKFLDTQIPLPIQVLSSTHYRRQVKEAHHPPLFTLDQLPSDFSDLVDHWLRVSVEMESVCSLYFGVLYSEKIYATQAFLNMVQAAESYHRLRFGKPKAVLLERLRALINTKMLVVPSYVGPTEDFIKKVRDTRNYYTHYSADLAPKAAQGQEVYYLAQALAVVIQSWLLRELGFSEHRAIQIIHSSSRYNYLKLNHEMSGRYIAQVETVL